MLWFLAGIIAHIQIFPLDMTVSDRWFYFPIVGILGIIGVVTQTIKPLDLRIEHTAIIVVITILTLYSLRSIKQNMYWHDGISLYSYNMQMKNHDVAVENQLAIQLAHAGRINESQIYLEELVAKYPRDITFINNLATVYELQGNFSQAKVYYNKILEDGTGDSYYALARITLDIDGDPIECKMLTLSGLQKYPKSPYLWKILALADYALGNKQDALAEAKKAVDILPNPETEKVYKTIYNDGK